ncbi:MAG: DoxX family protein [Gammaproteobacteria bacterium]|nr:DoxX family protein [Gammaproteobacteria bacterium]
MSINALQEKEDMGKLILRMTVGILMLFHGVAKIRHPGSMEFINTMLSGAGLPTFIAYGVYIGEVLAPLLIILGLFTRYSAMVIVVNMLFAVFLVHTGHLFMLTDNGGWRLELQGFFLFTAAAIVFLGSGQYAIKPD